MSYVTKAEVEYFSGLSINSSLNSFITTLTTMAEDYIEKYCGGGIVTKRWFDDDDAEVTRYYNGDGSTKIMIDDLRSLTSLVVDGITLTVDEDFYLYPLNATADGVPYEWIELIQPETRLGNLNTNSRIQSTAPYIFEERQKNIAVKGKFGYSKTTAPDLIKTAVLKLVTACIRENVGDTDVKEITSESLGDYSVSFGKIDTIAYQLELGKLLDPYVRKTISPKSGYMVVS
jgi:hypothetical protein